MKGKLPASCRIIGYALLILSVFVPLLMYMFGMVDDTNLLYVKMSMKLVIWLCLFMVFLAKAKEEDAEAASLRSKAMQYALYVWGLYYIVLLVKGAVEGDLQVADNSVGIVYMVLNVLVWEFFLQKRRMEKMFRRK